MEGHDNQFDPIAKCVNLTAVELRNLNLINTMIDLVCAIITALMLAILIFFKAYSTVLQRLFLYYIITSVLRAVISFSMIEHQGNYTGQKSVCEMLGFLVTWADYVVCFLALQIIVYMVFQVYCLIQGNPFSRVIVSKYRQWSFEFAYVSLSMLVAFLYATGPLFNHSYGLYGDTCWIQSFKGNCTVDVLDQVVFGYVIFEGVGVIGVFLLILIAIVYIKLTSSLQNVRVLLRKTLILIVIVLLYVFIMLFPIIFSIRSSNFGTWVIICIDLIYPLNQLLFTCGFLICFFSLNVKSLKRAPKDWRCCHSFSKCCSCHKRQDYELHSRRRLIDNGSSVDYGSTSPASSRVSQPSDTYFNPPFTNGFTDISSKSLSLMLSTNLKVSPHILKTLPTTSTQ